MPGSIRPIEPGLSARRWMAGAGRAGLGHAPAALEFHVGLALENPGDLDRQRRAARTAAHQRRQVAAIEIRQIGDGDPHRRHPGNEVARFSSMSRMTMRHRNADAARSDRRAPDCATGLPSTHRYGTAAARKITRSSFAAPCRPAPDIIDRNAAVRLPWLSMAPWAAGGAAGILQQRDILDRDIGPPRRRGRAATNCRKVTIAGGPESAHAGCDAPQ